MWIFTAWMWIGTASAQVEQCAWTPTVTVDPVRPPGIPATTRDFEECLVTLDIDAKGHPTANRDVEGCPSVFGDAAMKAFIQWRFQPCVLENRPFEGEITLAAKFASSEFQALPPAEYQARIEEHTALKSSGSACRMQMTVVTDGTITAIATNHPTHCLVAARRLPSQHVLKLRKPVTCEVSFVATGTRTQSEEVEVSKCRDEAVIRYAQTAAAGFAWNCPIGGSEAYTVEITLGPGRD